MTYALVALGGALVAVMIFAAGMRRGQGPSLAKKTVVIHTQDDHTIKGVLHGAYSDRLTVREASIVLPGGSERALAGLEHIPVGNISFVQEVPAPGPRGNGAGA